MLTKCKLVDEACSTCVVQKLRTTLRGTKPEAIAVEEVMAVSYGLWGLHVQLDLFPFSSVFKAVSDIPMSSSSAVLQPRLCRAKQLPTYLPFAK